MAMKHLLKILKLTHWSKEGAILSEVENIPNVLHAQGEFYCLSALFCTAQAQVPGNYYAGLDNRASPAVTDTLANLAQEPTQFGYTRQAVSPGGGFVVALNTDSIYQATTNVLTFSATGGTWGPVSTVFLATSLDNSGFLISTAALDGSHMLNDGEKLTVRLALTLSDLGDNQ